MEEKCARCAYQDECDVLSIKGLGVYGCDYAPILEQYESKGYKIMVYQTSPVEEEDEEEDEDIYNPFY